MDYDVELHQVLWRDWRSPGWQWIFGACVWVAAIAAMYSLSGVGNTGYFDGRCAFGGDAALERIVREGSRDDLCRFPDGSLPTGWQFAALEILMMTFAFGGATLLMLGLVFFGTAYGQDTGAC